MPIFNSLIKNIRQSFTFWKSPNQALNEGSCEQDRAEENLENKRLKARIESLEKQLNEEKSRERQMERNSQNLEWTQKQHNNRMSSEKTLLLLDEERFKAYQEQLLRQGQNNWRSFLHATELNDSLTTEYEFERFQQQCHRLKHRYDGFSFEFDSLKPRLIVADDSMRRNTKLDECDLEELTSALRQFREQAGKFSVEGAEDEEHHKSLIEVVIKLLQTISEDVNNIIAILDIYSRHAPDENNQHQGILQRLESVAKNRNELTVLMQQFNVIGRDHIRETLKHQIEGMQAELKMIEGNK